ncbi:prostatic acid phosphatase [Copidosoma floridanum]|uniref:prostatic acid phosphatase n=1 Tax=Copidosoma floridanum TaxID=29053 RepID=UPI0006C97320|nr:prostatic acid phosphatase [Copidosoma floridanum]
MIFNSCPLFLLFLIIACCFCDDSPDQETDDALGKVVFANIMFRHGDRTPVVSYPNDPYRNENLWPVPFGQLTNLGKHQQLQLGMWLRQRYNHLIPKIYSVYDIYVRSTDVDRTLMSAESNLAGLYPPFGNQEWDIKRWMPIPVHTTPVEEDMLSGNKYCERYNYELENVNKSPEMVEINKKNEELYKYLSKMSGSSINSLETLLFLYNTLFIEEIYNKTLPKWTASVYPDKMEPLAVKSFEIETYNQILKRLKSGPLLKEMIKNMVLKSKNALTPDRKLWIFSAHDETVANMLNTLGVFEPHCPPYAATILIELRVDARMEYFVTVSYKNSTKDAKVMTLPGCIPACPLHQFIKLTRDVVPTNWERECLMGFKEYQFNVDKDALIVMLSISVLTLVLLSFITILFVLWTRKKDAQYYSRLDSDGT